MIIDYGTFSQRLRQRTDRWSLLETFVREWELPTADYPLVLPEDLTDAEARLGFSLPAAVWEWYLLPSQPYQLEPSLLTGSWMVDPEWLEVAGDFLPLHREQQDCCQWAIRVSDMSLTDPPVYIGAESLPWRLHNTTFSEFALHLVVRDIIGVRGYWAYAGTLGPHVAALIERHYAPLGFPDWFDYPASPGAQFFGGPDVIILVRRDVHATGTITVNLSARSPDGLRQALQVLPLGWDTIDDSGTLRASGPDEGKLMEEFRRHQDALTAALQAGDAMGEANARSEMAWICGELRRFDEAVHHLERSIELRLTTAPDYLALVSDRAYLEVYKHSRHRQALLHQRRQEGRT